MQSLQLDLFDYASCIEDIQISSAIAAMKAPIGLTNLLNKLEDPEVLVSWRAPDAGSEAYGFEVSAVDVELANRVFTVKLERAFVQPLGGTAKYPNQRGVRLRENLWIEHKVTKANILTPWL